MELPADLRELQNAGILRPVTNSEFMIDALQHPQRTWMGWTDVTYCLSVEKDDDGQTLFEIAEQTRELGGDIVVSSTDSDEVACWITELIQEKEA